MGVRGMVVLVRSSRLKTHGLFHAESEARAQNVLTTDWITFDVQEERWSRNGEEIVSRVEIPERLNDPDESAGETKDSPYYYYDADCGTDTQEAENLLSAHEFDAEQEQLIAAGEKREQEEQAACYEKAREIEENEAWRQIQEENNRC